MVFSDSFWLLVWSATSFQLLLCSVMSVVLSFESRQQSLIFFCDVLQSDNEFVASGMTRAVHLDERLKIEMNSIRSVAAHHVKERHFLVHRSELNGSLASWWINEQFMRSLFSVATRCWITFRKQDASFFISHAECIFWHAKINSEAELSWADGEMKNENWKTGRERKNQSDMKNDIFRADVSRRCTDAHESCTFFSMSRDEFFVFEI